MNIQDILVDFLTYLYENNIDIVKKGAYYDWQYLAKEFLDKSGHANMTKKQLKRAKELLDLSDDSSPMNTFSRDNCDGLKTMKSTLRNRNRNKRY